MWDCIKLFSIDYTVQFILQFIYAIFNTASCLVFSIDQPEFNVSSDEDYVRHYGRYLHSVSHGTTHLPKNLKLPWTGLIDDDSWSKEAKYCLKSF